MAGSGTAQGGESERERAERVLAERARELARPPPGAGEEVVPVVAFEAGGERYAVTMEAVLRVERVSAVARVPGAPPEVIGVMSVDGRPCPLVDAAALLGAPAPAPGATRPWAVVLGNRAPELALAADAIDLGTVPRAILTGGGPRLGTTADARVVLASAALLGHGPDGRGSAS